MGETSQQHQSAHLQLQATTSNPFFDHPIPKPKKRKKAAQQADRGVGNMTLAADGNLNCQFGISNLINPHCVEARAEEWTAMWSQIVTTSDSKGGNSSQAVMSSSPVAPLRSQIVISNGKAKSPIGILRSASPRSQHTSHQSKL